MDKRTYLLVSTVVVVRRAKMSSGDDGLMRMKLGNACRVPCADCDQNKWTVCAAIDSQERCLVYCVAARSSGP